MDAGTRTVLVVDDEPHVVHVVSFKLRHDGLTVIIANNGNRAFDLACRELPDLIITDFQMPGGSGLELATRLRKNKETAEIPLIMLTARGHRAPLAELAETNVRALLAKPFSPRHLLGKVNELLERAPQTNAGRHSAPGTYAP
ncbi:MAG: response regulator [Planctomycetes bacterium]|nr:response regulator [Planctomycetota bacterium]